MLGHYLQSTLLRLDGWVNDVTGLGSELLDKTVLALFAQRSTLSDQYLAQLYESDGIARRICDKVPDEMMRAGYELLMGKADNAQELATQVRDKLTELGANSAIKDCLVWERALGGSAVYLGTEDGAKDPAEPLNEANLQDITHLTVVDKSLMTAARWYPATDPRAGRPEIWQLTPVSTDGAPTLLVHESRLLIFPGGRVTLQRRQQLMGWGQSVLRAVHDVLRDYQMSWQGVAHMLQSANQDVWYFSGYKNAMASGTPAMKEYFRARIRSAQMQMGPNRGVALDADGEKFERHGSQFSGVSETLQQLAQRMSAVTDMPQTVLFGMSPAGMNATGESDLQLWNTSVAAMQVERLLPQLKRLIRLLMLCKNGPTGGQEVEGWEVKFKPLKHLDDQQEADLRQKQAAVDKIYIDAQVLLPEEVALARFRPEGFSTETTIDLDARRSILDAELERAVEEAEDPPEPPPQAPPPQLPPGGDDSGAPPLPPGAQQELRQDAFDESQPRDDSGKWSSTGARAGSGSASKSPPSGGGTYAAAGGRGGKLVADSHDEHERVAMHPRAAAEHAALLESEVAGARSAVHAAEAHVAECSARVDERRKSYQAASKEQRAAERALDRVDKHPDVRAAQKAYDDFDGDAESPEAHALSTALEHAEQHAETTLRAAYKTAEERAGDAHHSLQEARDKLVDAKDRLVGAKDELKEALRAQESWRNGRDDEEAYDAEDDAPEPDEPPDPDDDD